LPYSSGAAFTSTIFASDFASLTISTVRSVALQIQPNIEDVNGFDLSTFHVSLLDWSLFALQLHYFFSGVMFNTEILSKKLSSGVSKS
jgi:hypothetical protein